MDETVPLFSFTNSLLFIASQYSIQNKERLTALETCIYYPLVTTACSFKGEKENT